MSTVEPSVVVLPNALLPLSKQSHKRPSSFELQPFDITSAQQVLRPNLVKRYQINTVLVSIFALIHIFRLVC